MRKTNSVDLLVENLQSKFSTIPNFDFTQNDPIAKKVFNFVVKLAAEFNAFQNLFIRYYLPASLKSVVDFKRELKRSKYKQYFDLSEEDYMENYYETVRLGYVGAYHKYESFLKSVTPIIDEFFKELDFDNNFLSIKDYLKTEFDLELNRTIYNFRITKKINWICNCVKHKNGYPTKEPILDIFMQADKDKKIQIDSKQFKNDMQALIKHNELILSTLFHVGFHQFFGTDYNLIENQLKSENRNQAKVIVKATPSS